ncbi:superoxide dismutase [Orientia tsutsugamushi str. UT144]|uniref:Superoxide dismutase n=2 Tax=Orientia tsutsugamushi TaxID=784 RepID=A0A0F3RLQ9_ORITS|nr:superoxide dismutase [Orientia tsutsugamushi]KJW07305.1 superoxide dismutase [Orientia tsutsugamushi str. UT144]
MTFSKIANQTGYPFKLMELPYSKNSMEQYISSEAFDYHHGKHHAAYVNNLNRLLEHKAELQQKSLEDIILTSFNSEVSKAIFNNAAQIWNHNFFWHSICNNNATKPEGNFLQKINQDFGSYENFTNQFQELALAQFGSGWVWLISENGKLKIITTSNAELPIIYNQTPLLTCDVWEHSYYIDYRNNRAKYLQQFIEHLANWRFAEQNFLNSIK